LKCDSSGFIFEEKTGEFHVIVLFDTYS
jgi:hypothetical protein